MPKGSVRVFLEAERGGLKMDRDFVSIESLM